MKRASSESRAATVPLDDAVWQAWLRKNRDHEALYAAKRLKVALLAVPMVMLTLAIVWFFGR